MPCKSNCWTKHSGSKAGREILPRLSTVFLGLLLVQRGDPAWPKERMELTFCPQNAVRNVFIHCKDEGETEGLTLAMALLLVLNFLLEWLQVHVSCWVALAMATRYQALHDSRAKPASLPCEELSMPRRVCPMGELPGIEDKHGVQAGSSKARAKMSRVPHS